MSFSGFSEDDIRKFTKPQEVSKSQKASIRTAKKVTFKPNNTSNKSKNISSSSINGMNKTQSQELPENAKLSVPNTEIKSDDPTPSTQAPDDVSVPNGEETQQTGSVAKQEKKFKDLDEFDAKQKLIEEQNRKRKELLAKALADRTKRTQEEAQRLSGIQEEFKKLDAVLSSDVKILRKQIELASIEYMDCQKKYNRIEKEFLEAKISLHQKLEKKEMLTEHLCTIIEKNEERKAAKLTELLNKLEVNATERTKTVASENVVKHSDTDVGNMINDKQ